MWLDFNRCWDHPHHVAVVVSIQGVDPLTRHKGGPSGRLARSAAGCQPGARHGLNYRNGSVLAKMSA